MLEVAEDTPMTMHANNSSGQASTNSGRAASLWASGGYLKGDVPQPDMELAAVGRRTPMGVYMRRYRHPALRIIDFNKFICFRRR